MHTNGGFIRFLSLIYHFSLASPEYGEYADVTERKEKAVKEREREKSMIKKGKIKIKKS